MLELKTFRGQRKITNTWHPMLMDLIHDTCRLTTKITNYTRDTFLFKRDPKLIA